MPFSRQPNAPPPKQRKYPPRPIPKASDVDLEGRLFASPREVAAILGRSLVTLERWRRDGKGPPFVRLAGTRVGYPVAALHEWASRGELPSDDLKAVS